jgi:NTP pyrophosphatase (non-canonical NTP hydrolase)
VNFAEYQKFVLHSANHSRDAVYPLLGLCGETGEFMERVKKAWRVHGDQWNEEMTDTERYQFKSELGDILWYLVRVATTLNMDAEEIAALNVKKITDRKLYGKDAKREEAEGV